MSIPKKHTIVSDRARAPPSIVFIFDLVHQQNGSLQDQQAVKYDWNLGYHHIHVFILRRSPENHEVILI